MTDDIRWAWLDGDFLDEAGAKVALVTHSLHYGSGVFEGLRVYATDRGPALFRAIDHMERLHRSAKVYGLTVRWSPEELVRAAAALVARGFERGYLRPLAFYGAGTFAMSPRAHAPTHVAILARPLGAYLGEEKVVHGIRVTVSPYLKIHRRALPSTAKGSGQYASSILATHEAMDRGFDEALLLEADGTVAEGAAENVFFAKGGEVVTNDERSSVLMGVTRKTVLELCRDAGVKTTERPFTLGELLEADEIFFTGTAAEVQPVREIDGRTFRTGAGTITAELRRRYQDATHGRDAAHADWPTYAR